MLTNADMWWELRRVSTLWAFTVTWNQSERTLWAAEFRITQINCYKGDKHRLKQRKQRFSYQKQLKQTDVTRKPSKGEGLMGDKPKFCFEKADS